MAKKKPELNLKPAVVTFANGVKVINCTDQMLFFVDDAAGLVPVAPSGLVIETKKIQQRYLSAGAANLFKIEYEKTEEGEKAVKKIREQCGDDVYILGSEEAMKAYKALVHRPKLVFPDQSFFDTQNFEIYL